MHIVIFDSPIIEDAEACAKHLASRGVPFMPYKHLKFGFDLDEACAEWLVANQYFNKKETALAQMRKDDCFERKGKPCKCYGRRSLAQLRLFVSEDLPQPQGSQVDAGVIAAARTREAFPAAGVVFSDRPTDVEFQAYVNELTTQLSCVVKIDIVHMPSPQPHAFLRIGDSFQTPGHVSINVLKDKFPPGASLTGVVDRLFPLCPVSVTFDDMDKRFAEMIDTLKPLGDANLLEIAEIQFKVAMKTARCATEGVMIEPELD